MAASGVWPLFEYKSVSVPTSLRATWEWLTHTKASKNLRRGDSERIRVGFGSRRSRRVSRLSLKSLYSNLTWLLIHLKWHSLCSSLPSRMIWACQPYRITNWKILQISPGFWIFNEKSYTDCQIRSRSKFSYLLDHYVDKGLINDDGIKYSQNKQNTGSNECLFLNRCSNGCKQLFTDEGYVVSRRKPTPRSIHSTLDSP